jgi:hypothetical protein
MRSATAIILSLAISATTLPVKAADLPATMNYSPEPLEVKLLTEPDALKNRQDVIAADSISRNQLTIPSLWWTREQLPKKLIITWLAYPDRKYIDIIVNSQYWNILSYTERYDLISVYGSVGQRHGYNVRIFNLKFSEQIPIVAYTCGRSNSELQCNIQWQDINKRGQIFRTDK